MDNAIMSYTLYLTQQIVQLIFFVQNVNKCFVLTKRVD